MSLFFPANQEIVYLQNPTDVTIIHDSGFAGSFNNFLEIVHNLSIKYENEYIFIVKPHPIDPTNIALYKKKLPKCKFYVFDFRNVLKYSDYVLETANHYLELDFVNNIIISCWKGDDLPVIKNNRIKVVYNTEPKNPGTGQRN